MEPFKSEAQVRLDLANYENERAITHAELVALRAELQAEKDDIKTLEEDLDDMVRKNDALKAELQFAHQVLADAGIKPIVVNEEDRADTLLLNLPQRVTRLVTQLQAANEAREQLSKALSKWYDERRAHLHYEELSNIYGQQRDDLASKLQAVQAELKAYQQKGDLDHGMNCPATTPGNDEACVCGLKWRIILQTEQTMHASWRKRAEEAEAENAELKDALKRLLDIFSAEFPAQVDALKNAREVLKEVM